MVNSFNLNSGKSKNSQRLSDLLDNRCASGDFDQLLEHADTKETWYRFQTVSSLLRNDYSARATSLFCHEISSKLASEPAIIAAPPITTTATTTTLTKKKPLQNGKGNQKTAEISPIKRFSGGLAIAASAAFATFFSVQTLQLSDKSQPNSLKQHAAVDGVNNHSTASRSTNNVVSTEISTSLEQTQLEFSSDLYKLGVLRSGDISQQKVSGAYVKTIRLSAEQWQDLLKRAAKRKTEKDASQSQSHSDLSPLGGGAGSKENH